MTWSSGRGAVMARAMLIGVLAFALAVMLAPRAGAATAGTSYVYTSSFGGPELGTGGGSVATESGTGNVLATNNGDWKTQVYAPGTAGGSLLTTIQSSGFGASAIAVDPVDKSVYVMVPNIFFGGGDIDRYTKSGGATPTYTRDGSFSVASSGLGAFDGGLAIDPVTRNLLAVDTSTRQVLRINRVTGAAISTFNGSDAPNGAFGSPTAIAVAQNGVIYVVDSNRVERFTSAGVYSGTLATTGSVQAVAVNHTTGAVAVITNLDGSGTAGKLNGFTAAGTPTFQSDLGPGAASGLSRGVAWDDVNDVIYAAVQNQTTPEIEMFSPAPQPGIDPPTLSAIGKTSVHVSSGVDAGTAPPGDTHARFEYCNTTSACDSFPSSDPNDPANPWHKSTDQTVSSSSVEDDFTDLAPNTTYKVRAVAYNTQVTQTSNSVTFTTDQSAPAVVTGKASEIEPTDATLNGTINPFGLATTYHFEYGTSTDYGLSIPVPDATAFNGTAARTFTRRVAGLQAGTTYHFRLVATNAIGTTLGADQTFSTASAAGARGYEQVTPVSKRGATINEVFGFQAKTDGSALEYALQSAPADVVGAPQFPRYMSARGSSSWQAGQALDPPTASARMFVSSTTLAVSSDFGHSFVSSNRALAPGAVDGQANLYAVDVATGAYHFVGTSGAASAFGAMVGLNQSNMFLAGASDFSWIVFASTPPLLPGVTQAALYKWTVNGGLQLLSKLPDGTIPSSVVSLQLQTAPAAHFVSDDGSQGYFALTGGNDGVYRWANGTTTEVSVSHATGGPTGIQPAQLVASSRDGRYVVFMADQLTDDAPAGAQSAYLYDSAHDSLTYIGTTGSFIVEDFLAVSDDAQTVYLNSSNGLLAWRNGTSHIIRAGGVAPLSSFVSPNGRYLAFVDGPDRTFRPDVLDVYLYDADTQQLDCVTCANGLEAGQQQARLPSATRNISNRVPVAVTDGGTVFFDTNASLTAGDRNGMRDVYSYHAGDLTLISPGTGKYDARYSDASDDGNNVFFTTAQPLVGQDTDSDPDIYDARVGGGLPSQSPPAPPATCVGTQCKEATAGVVVSPFVVTPSNPIGPQTPQTNLAKIKISLPKVTFTSKALHISIRTSDKGRAKVTGSRVSTTVRNLSKAGTYTMVVPLSKKAQSLRRAHRKFKVTAKVTVTGGWGSATAKISRTLGK